MNTQKPESLDEIVSRSAVVLAEQIQKAAAWAKSEMDLQVEVAGGSQYAVSLDSSGTVWAWGNNASGELGDGKAPTNSLVPVQVKGLGPGSGVVAIAAGGAFGMALKADGTTSSCDCWRLCAALSASTVASRQVVTSTNCSTSVTS